MIDPVFTNIISLSLSVLLVTAAADKLKNYREFHEVLSAYQLLPEVAVRPCAWLVPALELVLALGLVLSSANYLGAGVAALLAMYAAAILINVQRGNLKLDCGCHFGKTRQSISMSLVYRNLVIAAVALLLLLPTGGRALGAFDYVAVTFGVLASALLYVTTNTLIANSTTYREVLT